MTTNVTTLIAGLNNIKNAAVAVRQSRAQMIEQAGIVLCSSIKHAHDHGDVTVLDSAADMFPAGSEHAKAAMAFLVKFAPADYSKKEGCFLFNKGRRFPNFIDTELAVEMLASNWEEAAKKAGEEKPKAAFDYLTKALSMLKAFSKAQEAGEISEEAVQIIQKAATDLEALKKREALTTADPMKGEIETITKRGGTEDQVNAWKARRATLEVGQIVAEFTNFLKDQNLVDPAKAAAEAKAKAAMAANPAKNVA